MAQTVITEEIKSELEQFLKENQSAELVTTYLFYVEKKFNLRPVLFPKDKIIYQSAEDAVKYVEQQHQLWHETEIKIGFSNLSVNEQTKKIYICPFTGKVFGDNTHPNPQDAIYDWVSKCPENTERVNGLRVKRFFISDDPEVIKSYAAKFKPKEPITKVVYSSVLSGKLFNTKEAVIKDFKQHYLKRLSLMEVQNQNRFQLEEHFLEFIQSQLVEDKIASFVEALAEFEEFSSSVAQWLE
ncbi:Uncharacterized protein DB42_DW00210 [Neochlamydia sp. EPS4]|jgi:hypothetical protein|uniref:DUF2709 domain-containing protein n=1 Tax=unclassified Neochlamydia TaxID=2643326 RepID=UPI00057ECFF5|nr:MULTISPECIES: DUF2709 domain-containing protein [unclassified Neochlamydia]KIC76357.1 Uncharacterized protein DB42_DW00210 [Neochlamydia sp. EPS4]KIC77125.1 Uncharacterized protein DB41_CZ00060 [Neochlamydia sp. TUME1]BBI17586.1 Uncharacterized protein NCS13_1_1391 [Neochlamydia sp. S13]